MANHTTQGKPLEDPELLYMLVQSVFREIRDLAGVYARVYVVGEGNHEMKRHEAKRRDSLRQRAYEDKQYCNAFTIPDCFYNLLRKLCEDLENVVFILPPGDAEATLVAMLRDGVIDCLTNASSDLDVLCYECDGNGLALLNPMITGTAKGRKRGTDPGGFLLEGKPVSPDRSWDRVVLSVSKTGAQDVRDLSAFRAEEKALVFALAGHDYDSLSSEGKNPRAVGLKGVGFKTAVDIISSMTAADRLCQGVDFFERALSAAEDCVKSAISDVDKSRLIGVAMGIYHSPVLKFSMEKRVPVGGVPYNPLTDASRLWLQANEPEFLAQLENLGNHDYLESCSRIGCTGCNVDADEISSSTSDLQERVEQLDVDLQQFVPASTSTLPQLHEPELNEYMASISKISVSKRKEEGLKRASDSAHLFDQAKVCFRRQRCPPSVMIHLRIVQSQARGEYPVLVEATLDANCQQIVKVVRVTCSCFRKNHRCTCKHKCAALCFLWLNTALGLAGNPTARVKYWAGQAAGSVYEETAVRSVELFERLNDDMNVDDVQAIAAGEQTAEEIRSTKKRSPRDVYREESAACEKLCSQYFQANPETLREISQRYGVKRGLTRAHQHRPRTAPVTTAPFSSHASTV